MKISKTTEFFDNEDGKIKVEVLEPITYSFDSQLQF